MGRPFADELSMVLRAAPAAAVLSSVLLLCLIASACASAVTGSALLGPARHSSRAAVGEDDDPPQIQPDRPDVTNAAYTVPPELVQLETGGQRTRVPASGEAAATPVSVRVGLNNWSEARVETDGVVRNKDAGSISTQFAGLAVGGKFRLWAPASGTPALAIQPSITLPWGRGSEGGTDYEVTFITGGDLNGKTHLDVNYTVQAAASSDGHQFQQVASASMNVSVGPRWNPYVELYWVSSGEPGARPRTSVDLGAICVVKERLALDGGIAFGLGSAANGPAVFGGLSVIVGELAGHRGIHARLLDAQRRGDK